MPNRRDMLAQSAQCAQVAGLLASLGLWPALAAAQSAAAPIVNAPDWNAAAFDAKRMPEVMKALGVSAPMSSSEVTLTAPDIAENGAVVPVVASSTAAGVRRLMFLVERNPAVLSAVFDVSEAVEPSLSTRVKMAETSQVYAVALTADGKVLYAAKEVKVTLGGCGG
jgi:sulfur-oxidizing protein SoxY